MNKFFLTFLIAIISLSFHAQTNVVLENDYLSSVSKVVSDDDGNLYVFGSYKGNCHFGDIKLFSAKGSKYITRINADGSFAWVNEYTEYIWDFIAVDSTLKILFKERNKDPQARAETQILHVESLNATDGKVKSKTKMAELDGEYFNINLKGHFKPDGNLISIATWKKDKKTYLNGRELDKAHFSGAAISSYTSDGKESWFFDYSGGVDGYTNLRTEAIQTSSDGTVYIVTYFGKEMVVGDEKYTTKASHQERGLMTLYDNALVLFSIKDGELVNSMRFADYEISTEHFEIDDENNLYLSGYFSGNETFKGSGLKVGYYKNALINGEKLESTPINTGINAPSEATFLVCLDSAFKTKWLRTYSGQAYVQSRSLSVKTGDVYLTGMFMHKVTINALEYQAHPDNGYKHDAFMVELDSEGNYLSSTVFNGENNDWIYVLASDSLPILYGSVDKSIHLGNSKIDAGDSKHGVGFVRLPLVQETAIHSSEFKIGDKISGNWKGKGRFYPGVVAKIDGDKYYIEYEDGDVEWTSADLLKLR